MERLAWIQRFLDELAPIHEPGPTDEDLNVLMFWHREAIFLDFHGRISPHGLRPDTVDSLIAVGVLVVGQPGDNSEIIRMFGAGLEGPPGQPIEYPIDFLAQNGWLGDWVRNVEGVVR